MPLSIGETAPDFSLFDTNKKIVTLSSFRGKTVVLLFSTRFFKHLHQRNVWNGQRICVLWRNECRDYCSKRWLIVHEQKFKEINQLGFTLLSDFNKEVAEIYDVLDNNFAFGYRGVSKRASFVIDPAGIIVFAEVLPSPGDYPDMSQLKQTVMNLS